MKPPCSYFGSKGRIAQRIVDLMPPHSHYVEPFAGGLSVLLAKPPSAMETVNDLDGYLVNFWRVLRERPDDLARVCALTPHARAEIDAPLDHPDDLERARRVWVQLTQARGGTLRRTGWRYNYATDFTMPRYLATYVGRIAPCAQRLARVSLECRDALDVIADYGRHPDVLIYADPPYPTTVRGGDKYYRVEMDASHEALLEALLAARCAVLLSSYPNPLYDDALTGWHRTDIAAITQVNGGRVERVWCNRPPRSGQQMLETAVAG